MLFSVIQFTDATANVIYVIDEVSMVHLVYFPLSILSTKTFELKLRAEFTNSSCISLLLILQASYVSYVVAELVQCLFVWGFVGFGVFCFQNKHPVSISWSCIEQDCQ